MYYCDICNSKLQINDGGYLTCPKHAFEEFGKPDPNLEAEKSHARYVSRDDRLADWSLEHWDDI